MLPDMQDVLTDWSGTRGRHILYQQGYRACPITRFGDHEYLILCQVWPKPGPMTAEVIDVTKFDDEHFKTFRVKLEGDWATQEWGYVLVEEGISLLTVHDDKELYEYTNPLTAVLSFRVEPPTREDVQAVASQLDDELQETGPRWPLGFHQA